jgi:hypothetical protein
MMIPRHELENLAKDAEQLADYIRKAIEPEPALAAVKWTNAISVRLMDLMAIYLVEPSDATNATAPSDIARVRWFSRMMRK